MSGEPLEYEAGEQLDAEAQAFLGREGKGFVPTPEYDPANDPDLKKKVAEARPTIIDPAAPEPKSEEPTVEEKAAQQGWAPQDQWRGPPGKWVDAETFLKRGENNPRVLRERLEATERKHADTIAKMEKMNQQALERQKAELAAQRDQLITQYAGNPDAIRQINRNYEAAKDNLPDPVAQAQSQEVLTNWQTKYSDIARDPVFQASAANLMQEIIDAETEADTAGKSVREIQEARFERLNARLAQSPIYGRFFEKTADPVDAGAPPAGSRQMDGVKITGPRSTNHASKLPAAAKVQGERFVKQGLFPNLEAYAKDYMSQ